MGDKLGDKSKTRLGRRTQHPRPETSWETRPETRARQDLRRGHSIPAKADTLKTALRTPTVNCLGKKKMKPPRKGWLVSLQIPIPSLMIENIPIETNHPNGVLSTQFVRLLVQSLQAPNPQTSELQGGPRVASYKWG